jgi:protein TonB
MHLRSVAILSFVVASLWGQDTLVRVSEDDAKKLIVTRVDPAYPAVARQMHVAGKVVVDIYLDEEGKVEKAQPVNGHPILSDAAVTAVKKWKFTPYMSNGHAHKAVTALAFQFKL